MRRNKMKEIEHLCLWGMVLWAWFAGISVVRAADRPSPVKWHSHYGPAMNLAEQQKRQLLIYFSSPEKTACGKCFDHLLQTDKSFAQHLHNCVCLKLPLSATIRVNGEEVKLLEQDSFSPLHGKSGIALVDLTDPNSPHYCTVPRVVSFDQKEGLAQKLLGLLGKSAAATSTQKPQPSHPIQWLDDYAHGMKEAKKQGKLMLIYFRNAEPSPLQQQFESETLSNPDVQTRLASYVCVRLACDASIKIEKQKVQLLETPAFAEMWGQPGIAILDFAHRDAPYYEDVVSTFPLLENHFYTAERMAVILDLPPGTLTQRTLIYAVRVHPEQPQSTTGELDPYLVTEAETHAQYQADVLRQGHQQWDSRFQRLLAYLGGMIPAEVCAESWSGDHMVEAAIECVRCWRLSDGHWRGVSSFHPRYGYDMKLGANGIWYATGDFGG